MQFSRPQEIGSPWCRSANWKILCFFFVTSLATALYCIDFSSDSFANSPFCSADGICHEKADQPSPRTIYSSKSKERYEQWWNYVEELNESAKSYAARRKEQTIDSSRPLILLGDSITESWLGTSGGIPSPRCIGIPSVLHEMIATFPSNPLDPLVLAISGDQTQHLLYRMQYSFQPEFADNLSSIYVVMIGTNNLGAGELPGPTADGVLAVTDYILSNTKGTLLLFKVLPRGDNFRLETLCPPRCYKGKPFKSFMPAINKLNMQIAERLTSLGEKHGPNRIKLIDCVSRFLVHTESDGDVALNTTLMPDFLHPNAEGHRVIAECISQAIRGLEKG